MMPVTITAASVVQAKNTLFTPTPDYALVAK
jgi:hypothetical protein